MTREIKTVSPVAKRLREARKKAGLSQKELGIAAGIDQFAASPRVNQYEQGKHQPDFGTLKRLAAVLKVPPPFFYTEDEELALHILSFNSATDE